MRCGACTPWPRPRSAPTCCSRRRERIAAIEARLAAERDLFQRAALFELLGAQQRIALVVAADEAVAARLVSAPMVEIRPSLPNRPLLLLLLALVAPLAAALGAACLVLLQGAGRRRRTAAARAARCRPGRYGAGGRVSAGRCRVLAAGTGAFAAVLQFAGALKSLPGLAALPVDLTLLAALPLLPSLLLLLLLRDWEVGRGLALPLLGVAGLLVWLVLAGTWSGSRLVLAEKLPQVVLLGPAMLLAGLLVGGDGPTLRRFAAAVIGIGLLVGAGIAWGLATDQVVLGGAVGADPARIRVQYQLAGLAIACAGGLAALRLIRGAAAGRGRPGRCCCWRWPPPRWCRAAGRRRSASASASAPPRRCASGWSGRPGGGARLAGRRRAGRRRRPAAAAGGPLGRPGRGGGAPHPRPPLRRPDGCDAGAGDPLGRRRCAGPGAPRPSASAPAASPWPPAAATTAALHPHNHALEVLVEAGLPGLALWLLAFGGAVVLALARAGAGGARPGRADRGADLAGRADRHGLDRPRQPHGLVRPGPAALAGGGGAAPA